MKKILLASGLLLISIVMSCQDDEPLSEENFILAFTVEAGDLVVGATIDNSLNQINLQVPYNADLTNARPNVVVSDGASIEPDSGVAVDLTQEITYTVTAEAGIDREYKLVLTYLPNTEKQILDFQIANMPDGSQIIVDENSKTIIINVPFGTDVSRISPQISISEEASISPESGEEIDLSEPKTYTVTAQDGSTAEYVAQVNFGAGIMNRIVSFRLTDLSPVVIADIDDDSRIIKIEVPFGTDITAQTVMIETSPGASISPMSGSVVNFTAPVTFTVTAGNGVSCVYTSQVSVDPGRSGKDILSFSFDELSPQLLADIDQQNGKVTFKVPILVDPTQLVPTITISQGATIHPASGEALDFSVPQTYTVTAEDGSVRTYTIMLALNSGAESITPQSPEHLLVFYAWPSTINGSGGNINSAISHFERYDLIILGRGLEKPTHPDHAKTKQIIEGVKSGNSAIQIFGYINLGTLTASTSLTDEELTQTIDEWKALGATGIFGDEFGFDFGVSRQRQNLFVDHAHSNGLNVMANSWLIEDALDPEMGVETRLSSEEGDYIMLESFFMSDNASLADDFDFQLERAKKAYTYSRTKGIKVAALARISISDYNANSDQTDRFAQAWHAAAMFGFDAFQLTQSNFSALTSEVFYFGNPLESLGSSWKDKDWVREVGTGRIERSTMSKTIFITGNPEDPNGGSE